MASRACSGVVLAGTAQSPPATVVGEISDWNFEESAGEVDVSVMGDCTKAYLAEAVEGTVTLTGFMNDLLGTPPTADAGQQLFVTGTAMSLAIQPYGTASGQAQMTWLDVIVLSKTRGANVNGAITWDISCRTNVAMDQTPQA